MTSLGPSGPTTEPAAAEQCVVRMHRPARQASGTRTSALSVQAAYLIVLAGLEAALAADQPQTIVVLDRRGQTLVVGSVPTASPRAETVAINKAFIACTLGLDTDRLGPVELPLGMDQDPLADVIAGGIPLWRDAVVVGAIGVCGGDAASDHAIAKAAHAAADEVLPASDDRGDEIRHAQSLAPVLFTFACKASV